jgi:hypothetical protein
LFSLFNGGSSLSPSNSGHHVSSMEEEEAEAYQNLVPAPASSSSSVPDESGAKAKEDSPTPQEQDTLSPGADGADEEILPAVTSGGNEESSQNQDAGTSKLLEGGDSEQALTIVADAHEEDAERVVDSSEEVAVDADADDENQNNVAAPAAEEEDATIAADGTREETETVVIDPNEPFNIVALEASVEAAYEKFEETVKELYGGTLYYHLLFPDNDTDNNAHEMGELSQARLQRRLQIRLLAPHFFPPQEPKTDSNDATSSTSSSKTSNTFLWITAGHSAAAAHGNLYEQSYTAVMEKYAQDVFKSVGLQFEARNYAMGGYAGNMELSLCLEAVYGQHFDVFSWDFGMIDGRNYFGLSLFLSRLMAAAHKWSLPLETEYSDAKYPSMSFSPFVHLVGPDGGRKKILLEAEQHGMGTAMLETNKMLDLLKSNVPDANENELAQQKLPAALQYLICKSAVEGKTAPCNEYKYDTSPCAPKSIAGQVGWHPGWKQHQYQGVVQAKWLVTALREAVQDLKVKFAGPASAATENERRRGTVRRRHITEGAAASLKDGASILAELLADDHADRLTFMTPSSFDKNLTSWLHHEDRWTTSEVIANLTEATLAHSNALCHTALLPAQARYDGILSERPDLAEQLHLFNDHMGVQKSLLVKDYQKVYKDKFESQNSDTAVEADGTKEKPYPLLLTWEDQRIDRKKVNCTESIKVDYKDIFLVPADIGWVYTKIPNPTEIATYKLPSNSRSSASPASILARRGLVMICTKVCAFGKCPADSIKLPDDLRITHANGTVTGLLQIEVDGVPVTGSQRPTGHGCHALEHAPIENRHFLEWGVQDSYEINFNSESDGSTGGAQKHLHISSFIVM